MSFEIREKALLARIGRIKTKKVSVETPLLFPVINPAIQPVAPNRMKAEFGFEALITNAYIVKQRFGSKPVEEGLHRFLGFDGAIMTDSGAYQILVYGDIRADQQEIVQYQEQIDTDIATMLDIPTGWKVSEEQATETVKETLKRAKQLFKQKTRDDILWVGPVQGGRYLNLVAKSAREMGKMSFQIHALGSPTEVMERYRFDVLVDMIMTAKMSLPADRPLHLFGAGHPFMFALAVALGCDLFDSAAYALYAREDRYMTECGTSRLGELSYFPCSCPNCVGTTPKRIMELPQEERTRFLAEHNLYVCAAELKRIKQAIKDGRLWEHLEMRAHAHPALLQAVKRLGKYADYMEKHDPVTKNSGLFYFGSAGLARPEIVHYRNRLRERYCPPKRERVLLLVPQTQTKPFHRSHEFKEIRKLLNMEFARERDKIHVCVYAAPFGVVPIELDEVYPLSQHETAMPTDKETIEYVCSQIGEYIKRTNYQKVVLLDEEKIWGKIVRETCKNTCAVKKTEFMCRDIEEGLTQIRKAIQESIEM